MPQTAQPLPVPVPNAAPPVPPPPPPFKMAGAAASQSIASGKKTRLTFTPYVAVKDGPPTMDQSRTFTVMLNPAEFTHSGAIAYNDDKQIAEVAPNQKFKHMAAEQVSFSLLLDGTGVVPATGPNQVPPEVTRQLELLKRAIYRYDSKDTQPPHVYIVWGSMSFHGRLTSMSSKYTLFKPNGAPLRVTVDLSFVASTGHKEAELLTATASPELSSVVDVQEGDTLPLLCARMYGDASYYPEVARLNQLPGFRLAPGAKLRFPPLK